MSTDWGIGCRTCHAASPTHDWSDHAKYFSGEFDNCRDVAWLGKLIAARDAVVALADSPVGGDFKVDVSYYCLSLPHLADFFRAHRGHELAPMDEYGRFHDQCGLYVACEHGGRHQCALPEKHEPPCRGTLK